MATQRYRGFKIESRPYQNHQTGLWTVDFEIHGSGRSKSFSLDERYPTEHDAGQRCLELGRLVIDGRVGGWSLGSLKPKGVLSRLRGVFSFPSGGIGRMVLDLGILAVIVIGAIMLLRGAYLR